MRTFFIILCCIFSATTVHAAQTCRTDSIPASTPNSQLIDNGNGTITDLKTGLMWKQCLEGVSGSSCEIGSPAFFTWRQALQQLGLINNTEGFAGYTDWRLPNIKELISIVEEQCVSPAINLARFPNTPSSVVWSGSPYAYSTDSAWYVDFYNGYSYNDGRFNLRYHDSYAVRLVRGGQ